MYFKRITKSKELPSVTPLTLTAIICFFTADYAIEHGFNHYQIVGPIHNPEKGLLCEKLYNMPTFIPTENREDYLELFIEIEKSFETKLEIDTLLLQSLVLKLIHSLEKESEKQNKYRYFKSDKARAIDNIISYVKSDLTRNLCLDAISEYISISPIYLHRIFKEATEVTLREFVEEERLKKAVLLLTTTELNLTEIAFECGFSSQSYFSSVFKRKMNMSPRRYVKYLSEKYFENNKKL